MNDYTNIGLNAKLQKIDSPATLRASFISEYEWDDTRDYSLINAQRILDGIITTEKISDVGADKLSEGTVGVILYIGGNKVKIDGANGKILLNDGTTDRLSLDGSDASFKISEPGIDVGTASGTDLSLNYDPASGSLQVRGDVVNTNAEIFSHVAVEHWWDYSGNWVDQDGALFAVNGDNYNNQNVFFESVMECEAASQTTSTRIYNVTDGAVLADSTVSTTAQVPTRVRSSALSFASGEKEYKIQFKYDPVGTAGNSGNTYAVRLVHVQQ